MCGARTPYSRKHLLTPRVLLTTRMSFFVDVTSYLTTACTGRRKSKQFFRRHTSRDLPVKVFLIRGRDRDSERPHGSGAADSKKLPSSGHEKLDISMTRNATINNFLTRGGESVIIAQAIITEVITQVMITEITAQVIITEVLTPGNNMGNNYAGNN